MAELPNKEYVEYFRISRSSSQTPVIELKNGTPDSWSVSGGTHGKILVTLRKRDDNSDEPIVAIAFLCNGSSIQCSFPLHEPIEVPCGDCDPTTIVYIHRKSSNRYKYFLQTFPLDMFEDLKYFQLPNSSIVFSFETSNEGLSAKVVKAGQHYRGEVTIYLFEFKRTRIQDMQDWTLVEGDSFERISTRQPGWSARFAIAYVERCPRRRWRRR